MYSRELFRRKKLPVSISQVMRARMIIIISTFLKYFIFRNMLNAGFDPSLKQQATLSSFFLLCCCLFKVIIHSRRRVYIQQQKKTFYVCSCPEVKKKILIMQQVVSMLEIQLRIDKSFLIIIIVLSHFDI